MNATILHESRGRIRLRLRQKQMTLAQADLLEAWLQTKPWCRQVTVHERTCCVILYYNGARQAVLNEIRHFSWQEAERTTSLPAHSSRALNREFEEKLVAKVVCKAACTLFLPPPLRIARILWHMVPFVRRGLGCLLRRRIKVELLDALSISISAFRGDFDTAGMVMFLLEVGELLEEWTRKKSVADLARCMSLNVDRVWLRTAQGEVLVPLSQIQPGDAVVVRAGGIVPVDGLVLEGEVTVNQASLTGESIPVPKRPGGAVYAGTVVEEGECVLEVRQASGQSRYDQIVHMGVDTFRSEVLPADKAEYVARLRREGHTVLMVGDGINDSPALSEADAGIAISDGAAIAREIADITIAAGSLWALVELRRIAMALMARIHSNYRFVIGFNGALIALGVAGVLPPATSATLHNLSTLGVSLRSMGRLAPSERPAGRLP